MCKNVRGCFPNPTPEPPSFGLRFWLFQVLSATQQCASISCRTALRLGILFTKRFTALRCQRCAVATPLVAVTEAHGRSSKGQLPRFTDFLKTQGGVLRQQNVLPMTAAFPEGSQESPASSGMGRALKWMRALKVLLTPMLYRGSTMASSFLGSPKTLVVPSIPSPKCCAMLSPLRR